jgi:hypothetical protein
MKRLIVAVVIGSVILASAAPALANPVGAPPANKLGSETSAEATDPALRPLGQLIAPAAQEHLVTVFVFTVMGLSPPGMD